MEQKHIDGLLDQSLKYLWFLGQSLKEAEEGDAKHQIMYTVYEMFSLYQAQLPGLTERYFQGCFHGWVIISSHYNLPSLSLWNPVTSKTIRLPPLDGHFEQCLLTSPPSHLNSVLMLTRTTSPAIVLCQLDQSFLKWKEVTYAEQARNITGADNDFLECLTFCSSNGKVYGLISDDIVQVDIDKEHAISLVSLGKLPYALLNACPFMQHFLKGYHEDLFYIKLEFYDAAKTMVGAVFLFKLDMSSMIWKEMEDLKDAIFFLDFSHNYSVFYRDGIASELGGYVHIIFGGTMGDVTHSYNVKEKTISLSPTSYFRQPSQWECGLHGEIKPKIMVKDRNEENRGESQLLNIPFDVLKMIMDLCVGVEYLKFRATCKLCRLAAPMRINKRWRLKTCSLISPWLMVLDKHQGIITFIDPVFGDKYFMTTPQELIGDLQICCSRYGWLLLMECSNESGGLFFFNPFTNDDVRKLPDEPTINMLCFSHPPTCDDCVVVGLSTSEIFIHIPSSSNRSWTRFHMDFGGPIRFPTIHGGDIYALNKGALHVYSEENNVFTNDVVAETCIKGSSAAQYYLVNCDEHHLLLVMVVEVGKSVQVFKLNDSSTQKEWEKIDGLGRHMIYISDTTCLCVEAKTREMENKIYFPLLHSKTGKIVLYSLETCRYHISNDRRNIRQDFFGTKYHVHSHTWIQPSWS